MNVFVCVEKAWTRRSIWEERLPKASVDALLCLAHRVNEDASGVRVSVAEIQKDKKLRLLIGPKFDQYLSDSAKGEQMEIRTQQSPKA